MIEILMIFYNMYMDSYLTGLEEIKNKTNMVWMPPALSVPTRKTPKNKLLNKARVFQIQNPSDSVKKKKKTYC